MGSGHEERLTPRELEILGLAAGGMTARAISSRLSITCGTVNNHLADIYAKLHAANRAHAVLIATRRGLLPPADDPQV